MPIIRAPSSNYIFITLRIAPIVLVTTFLMVGPQVLYGQRELLQNVGMKPKRDPIEVNFEKPLYEFDPAASDSYVSLVITNNTGSTIEISHIGKTVDMLARLPSSIELEAGKTQHYEFLVKSMMLPLTGILTGVIGVNHNGHTDLITAAVDFRIRGLPIVNSERQVWKIGGERTTKAVKITLPDGGKFVGLRSGNRLGFFDIRLDLPNLTAYLTPRDTNRPCYDYFTVMTDPPLNSRLRTIVSAVVE